MSQQTIEALQMAVEFITRIKYNIGQGHQANEVIEACKAAIIAEEAAQSQTSTEQVAIDANQALINHQLELENNEEL